MELFEDPLTGGPVKEEDVYTSLAKRFQGMWVLPEDAETVRTVYRLQELMADGEQPTYRILESLDLLDPPFHEGEKALLKNWLRAGFQRPARVDEALNLARQRGSYRQALGPAEAKWLWMKGWYLPAQELADTYRVMPGLVPRLLEEAARAPGALRADWDWARWLPTHVGVLSKVDLVFFLSKKEQQLLDATHDKARGLIKRRPQARSPEEIYQQRHNLESCQDLIDGAAGDLGITKDRLLRFLTA